MKERTKMTEPSVIDMEMMDLHPVSLTFRGSQRHLEKSFLDEYFIASLPIVRFATVLSLVLYALFGILDAYLFPEKKYIIWLFRYGIFCPLAVVTIILSFFPVFKKVMQPLVAFLGILSGIGIIMMILLAPPPANSSYYAGLILVFMMMYTVIKLRFIWASCTCWLLIFIYEYTTIGLMETPVSIVINNNFFIIGANLIGMLSCYSIERSARRDFFLKTLLHKEQEQVRNAKEFLEERIEDRTAELVEANKRITREMKERVEAEKENKLIQAQLARHQKMESLGLMAGGVAHDLNNILSGIISYPELLLLDLPKDSKLKTPLQEIRKSGLRAAAVVADLLTVARGVASQYEIVSINDMIKKYLLSPEYKKQQSFYPGISLEIELAADLPNCKCSPVHIQKILMNLVNNAFEAIEITGTIILSTSIRKICEQHPEGSMLETGEYVLLRVRDNGPGIPADALRHIFEPFYTRKVMGRSGTGLGLAVVWNSMQEHKGTVDVTSDVKGTIFTLYFPVTYEKKGDTVKCGKKDIQGSASILIVDDEHIQRDIGTRILTKLGYTVHTADSGECAVNYLRNHSVDLVLLDMLMDPGMNGYQTLKAITDLHPGQKAIITSGFSESRDVKAALHLGTSVFVKKPYSIEQLGHAVKQVLQ
jgi:signal transduction histidine kinase